MFERTVYEYTGLEVRVSDHANEGALRILDNAVQGSEGGLRFSLQNIASRIHAYGNKIRFVSLYKNKKITGTIGACFRISGQGRLRFPSSYLRYLAFQSSFQAENSGLRGRRGERQDKEDSFRHKTLEIFSKPHLLDLENVFEGDRHVMYAFVESMNERSKNLVHKAGYNNIRSFLTVAFSRFSPKTDKRVEKLKPEDRTAMERLLLEFYRDYAFFCTDHIFHDDRYYILREGDEIIAGVLALPSSYRLYGVPGVWGWVMMKILPAVPYFRRLFQPGIFRYLVFDAVYVRKGHEKKLAALFETACALEGFNTGLTWLDDRSDLYDKIRTEVKMGALNRMLNAKPGLVYARFINMTREEEELFYDSPAYVSGFDFS